MIGKDVTWEQILGRNDLIGGELETHECGVFFRGPLAKITDCGETISFIRSWCAEREDGEWKKVEGNPPCIVTKEVQPQEQGTGGQPRVHFRLPLLGGVTIFPKGDRKLNPEKVKGLAPASERLLELYPRLVFDREKAAVVLTECNFNRQVEALAQLPMDATLSDLLSNFRSDGSKEEFLWSYIEAVTGEKDVVNNIY